MQQKEREQQSKKLREQGGRAETLSSSEGFSWQPAEKRAGMQKNGRTTTSSIKQRQNLQARRNLLAVEDHVDWCAIFVSWCADQAGMLETDSLPKYAVCDEGIRWFIKKGKWYNRKIEPKPGMIIFFDWDNDGVSEHTGIVEKYEDGLIYTIEGNSHDVCRRKWYAAEEKCIMGYGCAIKTKSNDL